MPPSRLESRSLRVLLRGNLPKSTAHYIVRHTAYGFLVVRGWQVAVAFRPILGIFGSRKDPQGSSPKESRPSEARPRKRAAAAAASADLDEEIYLDE